MKAPRSGASEKIGELVRDLRHKSSLPRTRLAERADVDVSHLARIEAGQANPTVHTLLQLAVALDVDPEIFLRGLTSADLPADVRPYSEADFRRELRRRQGDRG